MKRQWTLTALAVFEYLYLRRFGRLPVEWEAKLAEALFSDALAVLEPIKHGPIANVHDVVAAVETTMKGLDDGVEETPGFH